MRGGNGSRGRVSQVRILPGPPSFFDLFHAACQMRGRSSGPEDLSPQGGRGLRGALRPVLAPPGRPALDRTGAGGLLRQVLRVRALVKSTNVGRQEAGREVERADRDVRRLRGMRFSYVPHARERMEKFGISESEVRLTVGQPEEERRHPRTQVHTEADRASQDQSDLQSGGG